MEALSKLLARVQRGLIEVNFHEFGRLITLFSWVCMLGGVGTSQILFEIYVMLNLTSKYYIDRFMAKNLSDAMHQYY